MAKFCDRPSQALHPAAAIANKLAKLSAQLNLKLAFGSPNVVENLLLTLVRILRTGLSELARTTSQMLHNPFLAIVCISRHNNG